MLGINKEGSKEILGIWIGGGESSKFWLNVMQGLKSRGVERVYLFCVDGLTGFREAINAAFPQAQIQRCIIHQIRSSSRFVSYKDIKAFVADLKLIYTAVTDEHLMAFSEKWGAKYPSGVKSWEQNWDILSTFFDYPPEVRKIIYTTNIIEGLHRQFRKVTKNKPSFPNDNSLMKLLYLASDNISKKWTLFTLSVHANGPSALLLSQGRLAYMLGVLSSYFDFLFIALSVFTYTLLPGMPYI